MTSGLRSLVFESRGIRRRALVLASAFMVMLAANGTNTGSPHDGLFIDVPPNATVLYPNPLVLSADVWLEGKQQDGAYLTWQLTTGPAPVTFRPQGTSIEIEFEMPGTYSIRVSAEMGEQSSHEELQVTVYVPEATYFVSPDGDDRNDGRSVTSPFASIRRAARAVRPGDVVMLRGGVYFEYNIASSWLRSGRPGEPITFTRYPGEVPIIDGSGETRSPFSSNPSAPELIRVVGLDWYVFDGLVFRNSAGRGLALEGHNHKVIDVSSYANHGDGIFIRGDNNLIERSVSYDNYSRSNGGDSADGLKIDAGDGNIVRGVFTFANSDDGIDLWASTNSLVEYSVSFENGRGPTGNGNGFKLSSGGVNSGSTVRFNVGFSNRAHNFTDNGGGGLLIYNNTSYDAGQFGFVVRGRPNEDRSELINNISFNDRHGVLIDVQTRGGVRPVSRHNTWDLGIDDPRFLSTDYDDHDFLHLGPDSPAVDAGENVNVPFKGRAMDLGAFEGSGE